jgi:(2Fe-2S) ferredoxin
VCGWTTIQVGLVCLIKYRWIDLFLEAAMTNSTQYRVFVCTKQRDSNNSEGCCFNCSAVEIYQTFLNEIKQRQLEHRVEVRRSGCLDRCEAGAVVLISQVKGIEPSWLPTKIQKRILSNKHWYVRLAVGDIPEIVDSHFVNGKPVERKSSYV